MCKCKYFYTALLNSCDSDNRLSARVYKELCTFILIDRVLPRIVNISAM